MEKKGSGRNISHTKKVMWLGNNFYRYPATLPEIT